MSFDHEERSFGDVERPDELDLDDYSELGPDDSASQIGRAITTTDGARQIRRQPVNSRDGLALHWVNTIEAPTPPASNNSAPRYNRLSEHPFAPVSRRTSLRSSRLLSPTTQVPSKQDRVRYSWQSIQTDEPNRPRIHIIKIVSNTATASAGLPGGESFGFSISPGGRKIACYNSARLFILQSAALPVNISQEYSLKRRPLAVEVVDEGWVVAILTDEHTINVYDLSHHRVRRLKTFKPDNPTTTIALSPTGALLAAAYEGAVEVFSLAPDALSTDRRAARSERMDKLQFSDDGSTLIGTTTRLNAASTVVMSVPLFPAAENGIPTHEELKEAWCTNILEPVNILDSSHASFFRENGILNNEKLFAWNGVEDTFGILTPQNVEYNNVDFPIMISPPLSTCGGLGAAIHSVPTIDERGDTVAMVVNDRTIRLYSVPHPDDEAVKIEAHSADHELDEDFGCPFSDIRWVHSSANLPAPKGDPSQVSGRLVVVSPGGVIDPSLADETVEDVEGGRIIMFDFDPQYSGLPGQTFTFTLGKAPPQTLDEQEFDVAQEVALVRRRTVNASQKNGQRGTTLGRAASTVNRNRSINDGGTWNSGLNSASQSPIERVAPNSFSRTRGSPSDLNHSWDVLPGLAESGEAIEEPFDGNNPRSIVTLQRAASAATSQRIQAYEEEEAERAGAKTNGGVPLPQYTEEPNSTLPGRYRALAGLEQPKKMEKSFSSPVLSDPKSHRPTYDVLGSAPSLDALISGTSAAAIDRDRIQVSNSRPNNHDPSAPPMHQSVQRVYNEGASPVISNPRTPPNSGYHWDNASPAQRNTPGLVSPIVGHRSPPSNASASAVSPIISGPSSPRRPDFQSEVSAREPAGELDQREARERFYREQFEREKRERAERGTPRAGDRASPDTERDQGVNRESARGRDTPEGMGRFETRLNAHHAAAMQAMQQAQQSAQNQNGSASIRQRAPLQISQNSQPSLAPLTPSSIATSRMSHSNFAPVPLSPNNPYPSTSDVSRDTSQHTTSELAPPGIGRSRSMHNPSTQRNQHLPPHLIAIQDRFHSSTADSASSSLFPLDRRFSVQNGSGTVAHKITGWYPPTGSSMGKPSTQSVRPSSAPPGPDRGMNGAGKKKKWFSGRKTPTRKYLDDGTWMIEEGRKCTVM